MRDEKSSCKFLILEKLEKKTCIPPKLLRLCTLGTAIVYNLLVVVQSKMGILTTTGKFIE